MVETCVTSLHCPICLYWIGAKEDIECPSCAIELTYNPALEVYNYKTQTKKFERFLSIEKRIDRLERIIDKIQGRFKISKQTDIDDEFIKGDSED